MFVVCHTGGNVIFMSSIVFGPLLFLFFTFLGSEWFNVFIMNFSRSCTKCLCLTLIFDSLARVFCLLYIRFDVFPVFFFILICLDLFILCIWVFGLHVHMCSTCKLVSVVVKGWHQTPWKWKPGYYRANKYMQAKHSLQMKFQIL